MVKKKNAKNKKNGGSSEISLDNAFAGDQDVEYTESGPKKLKLGKKEDRMTEKELEEDLDAVEDALNHIEENSNYDPPKIDGSKPISKLKKGDKISIDGKEMEVDAHYVLMDHGTTKEMALEVFDSKEDKDYQLRYFDDQVEMTLELYELQEIMYFKKACKKISW